VRLFEVRQIAAAATVAASEIVVMAALNSGIGPCAWY
jgi:hypothetical protein